MNTPQKKLTQYAIEKDFQGPNDILSHYSVHEYDLYRLFDAIKLQVESTGIAVQLVDLQGVSDSGEEDTDHAETCTSDGQTIYLHNQLKDHGGIVTRIYDIMHMGCGHLIQWGANEHSGLQRYGDKAWEIGSVFHLGADSERLKEVEDYEFEAGKLGVSYLAMILETLSLDSDPRRIVQMYSDYVLTDKEYIIDYYNTGKSKNFFSTRKFDQPLIEILPVPVVFVPQKRSTIEIGLVRSDK